MVAGASMPRTELARAGAWATQGGILARGPWSRCAAAAATRRGPVGLQLAAGFCTAASLQAATMADSVASCAAAAQVISASGKVYPYAVAPGVLDALMPATLFQTVLLSVIGPFNQAVEGAMKR